MLRLKNNPFLKNVAFVASGALGAQVITVLFAPLITRIYGPEAFGLLGTFMALVAIAAPIGALTYPIAIVLPKTDEDSVGIAKLSILLAVIISVFFTLVLMVGGESLVALVGLEAVGLLVLLVPLTMLFTAMHQVIQQWVMRVGEFRMAAVVSVKQAFIINLAKVGVGWFHPIAPVLIVTSAFAPLLNAWLLFSSLQRSDTARRIAASSISASRLRALGKAYIDFPVYRAPEVFLGAVSNGLPIILLATLFGPKAAGFYALAKMVLKLPNVLVQKAVGDVFYPRIAEKVGRQEQISGLLFQVTVGLAIVGAVPYSIVVFFGDSLFDYVFGSEWRLSGQYAMWMSVWLIASLATGGVVKVQAVIGLQKQFLVYRIFYLMSGAIALYVGAIVYVSDQAAVAIFSISNFIFCLGLIIFVFRRSIKYDLIVAR